jgi:hypothetical protein
MASVDEILAQAESELAQQSLQQPNTTIPTAPVAATQQAPWYAQAGYDIGTGALKAGWGLADLLTLPAVAGARALGADVPYFGATKVGTQELANLASKLGLQEGTKLQQIAEFATPIPGKGKLDMLKQAGLGLASYLGMKTGEAALPESPYAALAGALVAPAGIQASTRRLSKAAPAIEKIAGIVTGNEDALRRAAQQNVLKAIGSEGAQRVAEAVSPGMIYGTGGVPLTAAEIVQTPSSAIAQEAIRQTLEGGQVLTPAIEARGAALENALADIGITPQIGEMSLAMTDLAKEAAAQKAAKETSILKSLGLTPELRQQTQMERGATLLESLGKRQEVKAKDVREVWSKVPKKTPIDAVYALTQAQKDFNSFERLDKSGLSGAGNQVIDEVNYLLKRSDGRARLGEIKALRSKAGAAATEASGKNPREVALMNTLREDLDLIGVEQILTKKAGARATPIEKLKTAIAARAELGQTFQKGVVGELLKKRRFELTTKASDVVQKVLAKPENVAEIVGKFGANSAEAVTLRTELLSRLEKASNPTEFIGKNKNTFRKIFGSDYNKVTKYAQSVGQDAPLKEYANLSESAIPKNIFANNRATVRFMQTFDGTLVHDFAKSKFVNQKLLKKGIDSLDALNENRSIARTLFKNDFASVEALLKDKQIADSPRKLATLATKGQDWTNQMRTAYGTLMSARGVVGALKRGIGPLGMSSAAAGLTLGGPGALLSGLVGSAVGYGLQRIGNLRESQLNVLEAQIYANPSLLKLASAPPTPKNITSLTDQLVQLGLLSAKANATVISQSENKNIRQNVATDTSSNQSIDDILAAAESELGQPIL